MTNKKTNCNQLKKPISLNNKNQNKNSHILIIENYYIDNSTKSQESNYSSQTLKRRAEISSKYINKNKMEIIKEDIKNEESEKEKNITKTNIKNNNAEISVKPYFIKNKYREIISSYQARPNLIELYTKPWVYDILKKDNKFSEKIDNIFGTLLEKKNTQKNSKLKPSNNIKPKINFPKITQKTI